jgi:hypothetical protein
MPIHTRAVYTNPYSSPNKQPFLKVSEQSAHS